MSEQFQTLAAAAIQGAAANVGPLIGVDLTVGEVTAETSSEPPEGEFAVMPMQADVDGEAVAQVFLVSPLQEIATLGRRMLDDEAPDKARAIGEDELDAIGEVLNLMSGAVDAAIRAELSSRVHTHPLRWWQSGDPGENALPGGEVTLARGLIQIAGAGTVSLSLILPPELARAGEAKAPGPAAERVILIGLDSELQGELQPTLESARVSVESVEPDDEELDERLPGAVAIFLSAERAGSLQLCRKLRTDNGTWTIPVIVCMRTPTRSSVIDAVENGAVHVLAMPAEDITLLRVLSGVRGGLAA